MDAYNLPDDRTAVIYCGYDPCFQPMNRETARRLLQLEYGIDSEYFLFVGRLEPRKNPIRLLKAFHLFRQSTNAKVKLVLAGAKTWSAAEVDTTIRDLDLGAYVMQLGYVRPEHLPHLYSAAELMVFVTLWEGFGLPAIEAMACGTPVLTSNRSCMPEIAADAALLVDPHRTDEIAAGMQRLYGDASLRLELRTKGLARAARFRWDDSARQTLSILRQVAAQRRRPSRANA
jgi:glycosyltransferase involved in cell wall biosynthesis